MLPDFEKYRHHVDDFDLSEDQKLELVHTVHMIMESFVDRAFDSDSVQHARALGFAKDAMADGLVIDLGDGDYQRLDLTKTFSRKKGRT